MPQTLEQIRRASARDFAAQKAEAPNISETTPSAITPALVDFARSLGGEEAREIPVIDDPHGLYGWCSDGVAEKIKADGGEAAFGWTIWEWPRALLTAEFHCVWKSPQNELLDITPKPKGETSIVFVYDPSFPQDFDFDKRPRNPRVSIYTNAARLEKARLIATSLSGSKLAYEQRRATQANLPLDEWLLRKLPVDPIPEALDQLIAVCNEFEEHFDTLGTSGPVVPDGRFIELAKRRLAIQSRFKNLFSEAQHAS
jgi:hypothetical protein